MDLLLSAREQLGRAMLRELLAGLRRTHLAYCGRSAGENKVSGKIFQTKGPSHWRDKWDGPKIWLNDDVSSDTMADNDNPGTRGRVANPCGRPRFPAVHGRSRRDLERFRGGRRHDADRNAIPAWPYRGLCGLYRDTMPPMPVRRVRLSR